MRRVLVILAVAAAGVLAVPTAALAGPPPVKYCSYPKTSVKPRVVSLYPTGGLTCTGARKVASLVRTSDGWATALRNFDGYYAARAFDYVAYPTGGYGADGYPYERRFRCDYTTIGGAGANGYPSYVDVRCKSGHRSALLTLNVRGS